MKRPIKTKAWVATFTLILGLVATRSRAQGPGGPPPDGGMGGPRNPGGGPGMHPPQMGAGGGFELGPPGRRWWDEPQFAASLKLRPEQRSGMDAIFEQNRNALLTRLDGVRQAEGRLHDLANAPQPDETAIFAQIDRVSQARADLEKATTHMLLLLRREMDPGQIQSLEQQMHR